MNARLRKIDFLMLFGVSLALSLALTAFQRVPGYTDAEYYFGGARRLFEGHGFSEMILWNYLDDPSGLPHPSHAYWMPLPSLLAAGGMVVFQESSFFAARLPFILLAALIPPMTALLAEKMGQQRKGAMLAGWLALFSGFYLVYTTLTEGFALVMVLGTGFLLTIFGQEGKEKVYRYLLPGALAGLMHLTRADGLVWLAAGAVVILWRYVHQTKTSVERVFSAWGFLLAGYLLVMGPWFWRNWQVFGSLLAPGGSRALWLQNYNQTFTYPADSLTFQTWAQSGFGKIAGDRLAALWSNLKTSLAVQGSIFLFPLIAAGLWRQRKDGRVVLGVGLWAAILGVMSFVFPYAGARGGFFHSGAAFQPLFWTSVPFGLDAFIAWGREKRNWDAGMARSVFGAGIIILALVFTGFLFGQRVIGQDWQDPQWQQTWQRQFVYEEALTAQGAGSEDIVMINNPAGLYAATSKGAVVTPDGTADTAWQAARQFNAVYLIVEADHVEGLSPLYDTPGDRSGWKYLMPVEDAYLYQITEK